MGKIPGEENGYPLQYSCLENSMGRGAWWATVHGVAKSWTPLKRLSTHCFSIWLVEKLRSGDVESCNQQRAQDLPIWELVLTGGLGCCSMDPMQSHWDFCSSQEFSLYLLQAGFSNITTNSSGLFLILFYLVFFFFFLDVDHFFKSSLSLLQ